MAENGPHTGLRRFMGEDRRRRLAQHGQLAVLALVIGTAAVVVPPLVIPDGGQRGSSAAGDVLAVPEPVFSGQPDPAPAPTGGALVNVETGKCLSTTTGAAGTTLQIWRCDGSPAQQWALMADGSLRSTGSCMDTAQARDRVTIVIAACSGSASQVFRTDDTGDGDHSFFIVNRKTGDCVDVDNYGTADGTRTLLWRCTEGPNQMWIVR